MDVFPGRRKTKRAAALAAVAATISIGYLDASSRLRSATDQAAAAGDLMTADVATAQMHVDVEGRQVSGTAPTLRYRLEHRGGSADATTTLTLVEIERAIAEGAAGQVALDNPFLPVRMELDARGGMRLYNRRGERVREATASDRRLFGIVNGTSQTGPPDTRPMSGRAGPGTLLVAGARAMERRAELERSLGAPVGKVRGLDRYLSTRRGDINEVLVDPDTALPVEINTVRNGVLMSHLKMTYDAVGSDTLVRRSLRSERALPDTPGRLVTTVDLTNVRISPRGGQ